MSGEIQNEEGALPAPLPDQHCDDFDNAAGNDILTQIGAKGRPETPEEADYRHRVMEEIRTGIPDPDWPPNQLANCDVPEGGWPADMKVAPSAVCSVLARWRRWERVKADTEEWRPAQISLNGEMIDLRPLYVSSQGRVVVCDRRYRRAFGRSIGSVSRKLQRYQVVWRIRGKEKWLYRYRIVLSTFIGPPPDGKPNACHWDGDPANDALANLRWDSQRENLQDMVRHGRSNAGERCHLSKLDEQAASEIIAFKAAKGSLSAGDVKCFARQYGVSVHTIRAVAQGLTWKHLQPLASSARAA